MHLRLFYKIHLAIQRTVDHIIGSGATDFRQTRYDRALRSKTLLSDIPAVEPAGKDSPSKILVLPAHERVFGIAHILFASEIDRIPRINRRHERHFVIMRSPADHVAVDEIEPLVPGEFGGDWHVARGEKPVHGFEHLAVPFRPPSAAADRMSVPDVVALERTRNRHLIVVDGVRPRCGHLSAPLPHALLPLLRARAHDRARIPQIAHRPVISGVPAAGMVLGERP